MSISMNAYNSCLNDKASSVTTFSTDFSFQNLVFWNLFEFSVAEILLIKIFPKTPKAHSNSSKILSYDLI